ncbi:hypothetical protein TNIN_48361 [Trichonephila inaurata madagascariensis]|uniref:Uncharacterized protein n=1 Tax=Trichonephila inaurata madagascariensis TaxID=2747483 RepID=A0A8X6YL42_9ARAC|nr:hypothetical protein TNIN_48361 [Trichonephila inaurata madagascariensis]
MKIVSKDEMSNFINRHADFLTFLSEKSKHDEQIQVWLESGITHHSFQDFEASAALAKKKNGSTTVCIDDRKLNSDTVEDQYPLPLIDDVS